MAARLPPRPGARGARGCLPTASQLAQCFKPKPAAEPSNPFDDDWADSDDDDSPTSSRPSESGTAPGAPAPEMPVYVDQLALARSNQAAYLAETAAKPVFSLHDARFGQDGPGRIALAHRPLTLVTRWHGAGRETPAESARYGRFMADAIEKTVADLRAGRLDNLCQLWDRATQDRQASLLHARGVDSADALGDEDRTMHANIAKDRLGEEHPTFIAQRYAYIIPDLHKRAVSLLSHPLDGQPGVWQDGLYRLQMAAGGEHNSRAGHYALTIAPPTDTETSREAMHWILQPPEKQPPVKKSLREKILGRLQTSRSPQAIEVDHEKALAKVDRAILVPLIDQHGLMVARYLGLSFPFPTSSSYGCAQSAIERALTSDAPHEVRRHAFEAYWYLCAAQPDARGSAAKAHYVLQSVLLAKGIDLLPANAGQAPDLEAMSRTLDDWLAIAPAVFQNRAEAAGTA